MKKYDLTHKVAIFSKLLISALRLCSRAAETKHVILRLVKDEPMQVPHITRILGFRRQSVLGICNKLVAAGLCTYEKNDHHRRAKLLKITDEGLVQLIQINKQFEKQALSRTYDIPIQKLAEASRVLEVLSQ